MELRLDFHGGINGVPKAEGVVFCTYSLMEYSAVQSFRRGTRSIWSMLWWRQTDNYVAWVGSALARTSGLSVDDNVGGCTKFGRDHGGNVKM